MDPEPRPTGSRVQRRAKRHAIFIVGSTVVMVLIATAVVGSSRTLICVVRGVGDIGSAGAHRLFREGCRPVIHDDPNPTTTRRGMAFADAIFDGQAELDGEVIGTFATDHPAQGLSKSSTSTTCLERARARNPRGMSTS